MRDYKLTVEQLQSNMTAIEGIIREAAKIILEASDQAERSKTKSSVLDLVTEYDVKVQQFLETELRALLPEAGFLGEEEGLSDIDGKPYYFIVDPIDGTSNFVADYRHSGISIALVEAQADGSVQPLLAAIYNPYLDELFTAIVGEGAKLNAELIQSQESELRNSLVLFGTSPYRRELADKTFALVKELYFLSRDLRRGGAAVLDLSYVACGRGALFFEAELSPWDYAAAALIVTEAGAVITDMAGQPLSFKEKSSIVAGHATNHQICLDLIKKIGLEA